MFKKLAGAFARSRKAVFAGVSAGGTALTIALSDASPGGGSITGVEWRAAAIAAVVAGVAIYNVPNAPQ